MDGILKSDVQKPKPAPATVPEPSIIGPLRLPLPVAMSNSLSPAPAGAVHPEHHTCSQRPASLQVGPAPQTRLSDHHSCLAQASGAGQPSCGAVVEF